MTSPTESQNPSKTPLKRSAASADQAALPSLLIRAVGSGLFTGYIPFASGTAGSFLGLLIFLIPGFSNPSAFLPALAAVFLLGLSTATEMEKHYGRDPSVVTIDEVIGMWIALAFLPMSTMVIAAAFVLFRVFDIVKPFPARRFDTMAGGFGIMMDDVVAGLYTNIVLQLLLLLPPVKLMIGDVL